MALILSPIFLGFVKYDQRYTLKCAARFFWEDSSDTNSTMSWFVVIFLGVISSIAWWRDLLRPMRWQKVLNQNWSCARSCRYFTICQGCTLMSTFLVPCAAFIIMWSNELPTSLSFDGRVSYNFECLPSPSFERCSLGYQLLQP